MSLLGAKLTQRIAVLWTWIPMLVPALALLVMIVRLRVPVPYVDSWVFAWQYLDWTEGRLGWSEFLSKFGDHPSVPGKAIYFAVLHWLRGDVGVLPLLGWAFSAVIAGSVCLLSRRLWGGNRLLGPFLMFCASLVIFNAAQGGVWLWDFTFQNHIPGVCLALGLVVLSSGNLTPVRLAAAALLSATATFSFGSGFLVGALFSILIWNGMNGRSLKHKCLVTGAWLVVNAALAGVALKAFGPSRFTTEGGSPGLAVLFDRPVMRLRFVLTLLGQMLGKGTVLEPLSLAAAMGAALTAVFLACSAFIFRHRRSRDLVTDSLPWVVCCLYGLANALLICIGRLGKASDYFDAVNDTYALAERTMSERFITMTEFFVFGVVFLAAAVFRHAGGAFKPGRWTGRLVVPALTVFIAALLLNWSAGAQHMRMENLLMRQERALLSFGKLVPPDPGRLWNRQLKYHTPDVARSLARLGRLPTVKFVPDKRLAVFSREGSVLENAAGFDNPALLPDGRWWLGGSCGFPDNDALHLPELALVTAEVAGGEELVVAVAALRLPETFFERKSLRRKYPDHYFGWSTTVSAADLPAGPVTLRAYALDYDRWSVRPVSGTRRIEVSQPKATQGHQE